MVRAAWRKHYQLTKYGRSQKVTPNTFLYSNKMKKNASLKPYWKREIKQEIEFKRTTKTSSTFTSAAPERTSSSIRWATSCCSSNSMTTINNTLYKLLQRLLKLNMISLTCKTLIQSLNLWVICLIRHHLVKWSWICVVLLIRKLFQKKFTKVIWNAYKPETASAKGSEEVRLSTMQRWRPSRLNSLSNTSGRHLSQ